MDARSWGQRTSTEPTVASRCQYKMEYSRTHARYHHLYYVFNLFLERFRLFERSEFLFDTSQKKNPSVRVCVRLILVLVWVTDCIPYTYVPGISRQKSIRTYVMFQIRMYLVSAGRNLYVRTLCSARGRTRLTTITYISCRSL